MIASDGSRDIDFSAHSEDCRNDPQPDYRVAIQRLFDFHDGSLSDQGDSGTTQTTSGGTSPPVAGRAWALVLRPARIPPARRHLYHHAARASGQISLFLLFHLTPAAASAASESVVDICERFEESLMLMGKTFGWSGPISASRKAQMAERPGR
jgi:hypothetical protein